VREAAWGNGSADKTDTAPQVDFTSPARTTASTRPPTRTPTTSQPDHRVPTDELHPARLGGYTVQPPLTFGTSICDALPRPGPYLSDVVTCSDPIAKKD
jgi:hypothetical protein